MSSSANAQQSPTQTHWHLKLNSDGGDLLGVFIPADHQILTISLQNIILALVSLYWKILSGGY
jgi:hypothetical protein